MKLFKQGTTILLKEPALLLIGCFPERKKQEQTIDRSDFYEKPEIWFGF